jgi:hypothetical protein
LLEECGLNPLARSLPPALAKLAQRLDDSVKLSVAAGGLLLPHEKYFEATLGFGKARFGEDDGLVLVDGVLDEFLLVKAVHHAKVKAFPRPATVVHHQPAKSISMRRTSFRCPCREIQPFAQGHGEREAVFSGCQFAFPSRRPEQNAMSL